MTSNSEWAREMRHAQTKRLGVNFILEHWYWCEEEASRVQEQTGATELDFSPYWLPVDEHLRNLIMRVLQAESVPIHFDHFDEQMRMYIMSAAGRHLNKYGLEPRIVPVEVRGVRSLRIYFLKAGQGPTLE